MLVYPPEVVGHNGMLFGTDIRSNIVLEKGPSPPTKRKDLGFTELSEPPVRICIENYQQLIW